VKLDRNVSERCCSETARSPRSIVTTPPRFPGTILKCEDENYALNSKGEPDYKRREQLYCYADSEKLYVLFKLDEHGEPHVRKYSSLVLGQLRSPVPVPRDGDPRAWIVEAWTREIRAALGKPTKPFAWEDYPAMEQLTVSTWNVFNRAHQPRSRRHCRTAEVLLQESAAIVPTLRRSGEVARARMALPRLRRSMGFRDVSSFAKLWRARATHAANSRP
jgi:hypothetical protein